MAGISTSQETLDAFGERVEPTVHLFALREGADATAIAQKLETTFIANRMEADSIQTLLDDAVGRTRRSPVWCRASWDSASSSESPRSASSQPGR